jgi:hypothetical protein
MANEPTSTLSFGDLIIEFARRAGFAYYGDAGDEVAQIPIDDHDLDECKRNVNNALRMFFGDAPTEGWRFQQAVASVDIWGDIDLDSTNLATSGGYNTTENLTTLNVTTAAFYETMEGHPIVLTGVGTFTIKTYVSGTQVKVTGDASGAGTAGVTFSMTSTGDFTLPRTFAGQYTGIITYESDTNQGVSVDWVSEATVRRWRENITDETGDPFWAAIRIMNSTFDGRRRWELVLYPQPDEVMTVEFPYDLHFDSLVDTSEYPPVPFSHDETIRAAVLAIYEKDVENALGSDWEYYQRQIQNSYRINSRSAPRKLGYFGNPAPVGGSASIKFFRNKIYDRPTITYT